jgi:hypothetical protein
MVYAGTVQGGVIVLENGVQLPEGQSVSVSPVETPKKSGHSILDIPTVSLGEAREGAFDYDDLLDEMLEGRV